MFRILDPAGLSGCFSSGGDFDGIICLEDAFFPRAEGCYRLHAGEGKLEIIRLEETGQGAQDFGKITMADLTRVLLSDDQERQQALKEADLTERGRKALDLIRPARRICVMEIV